MNDLIVYMYTNVRVHVDNQIIHFDVVETQDLGDQIQGSWNFTD